MAVLQQQLFVEATADATTAVIDPVFATLLTLPITTVGGDLICRVTCSYAILVAVVGGTGFRLSLDGTPVALTGMSGAIGGPGAQNAVLLFKRIAAVAAGAHTLDLEWALAAPVFAGAVLTVRPVTMPNSEHASLFVREVVN